VQEVVANRDIHCIGGSSVENLRLKPPELKLDVPGISVLKCSSARDAAEQIRSTLKKAKRLHEAAKIIGSTTEDLIRSAGFDIVPAPSRTLPNHYRIIHADGAAGFTDENLARLALVFVNTEGC
jgi:hypothetical protein